jgi:hypothetical protein
VRVLRLPGPLPGGGVLHAAAAVRLTHLQRGQVLARRDRSCSSAVSFVSSCGCDGCGTDSTRVWASELKYKGTGVMIVSSVLVPIYVCYVVVWCALAALMRSGLKHGLATCNVC